MVGGRSHDRSSFEPPFQGASVPLLLDALSATVFKWEQNSCGQIWKFQIGIYEIWFLNRYARSSWWAFQNSDYIFKLGPFVHWILAPKLDRFGPSYGIFVLKLGPFWKTRTFVFKNGTVLGHNGKPIPNWDRFHRKNWWPWKWDRFEKIFKSTQNWDRREIDLQCPPWP